jgi:hypothetical protein
VAGSGAATFGAYLVPTLDKEANDVLSLTAAAGWALQLIGYLLADEILTGANLPEYFGGGFDVAYYNGSTFRRVASTVQLLFTYEITSSRSAKVSSSGMNHDLSYFMAVRPTMFWQSVMGRELILERLDLDQMPLSWSKRGLWAKIKSRRTVEVPFLDLDLANTNSSEPEFAIIHHIITAGNSSFAAGCSVYKLPNLDFRIWRNQSTVRFRFSSNFVKSEGEGMIAALDGTDLRQKVEIALSQVHQI